MFQQYSFTVTSRFLEYVQIDTQSDPQSVSFPSTGKQKDLARKLAQELQQMGIKDAEMDEHGYVYATIPANTQKEVPVICFCSHLDTAPDCSGTHVKPILHRNYDGQDIVLPDNPLEVLSREDSPYLNNHIGQDIITASGNTLLGADDKAGIAIIMDFAHYLQTHPGVEHGTVKILFTPDEEVGRGTQKADLKKLGADFGYTLDGGEAGSLEDETFSANSAKLTITGVISHPGYAKGKLVNALKIVGEVLDSLPKDRLSPETTEGRQGFIHPVRITGIAEKASIEFIIRAFDEDRLNEHGEELGEIVNSVLSKYPGSAMGLWIGEQYRNMKDVLDKHPEVVENAADAIRRAGLEPIRESIRGGTDGSRFSYMGLPCPNLFTGMQNIHSRLEWIGVKDMEKAVETLVHLTMIWAEKAK